MPVELTEEALRDALAVLEEHRWEGDGPLPLRRYDVQIFLWYELPRRWLVSLEDKRCLAEALAQLLEGLGGAAASYAELCRSRETHELLGMRERSDPAARSRLAELLERSGIEPPDTGLLTWGAVMGLEEARARDRVALALEQAVEDGRLSPGSAGFRRRRAEVADAALRERAEEDGRRTLLDAVLAERAERWLQSGPGPGRPERRAIVARAAGAVSHEQPAIETAAAREALAATLWLLAAARSSIALTQTGALNRAFVRDTVARFPGWWDAELFGPPHREDDVALLCALHALVRRARLVRRRGRRIVATTRGRNLEDDPPALLATLAAEALAGDGFPAACAELAAALVLDGAPAQATSLAAAIHPAIVAEGWSAHGEPPAERDVAWAIGGFLLAAEAVGLLGRASSEARRRRGELVLTPTGRAGLAAGLRARAHAPTTRI